MSNRLGEYCVGNLRFVNKYDALVFASQSKQAVSWEFNDSVFSSFDWSIPINENIDELYRQRAQQLRDTYDYVSLFFSGGIDSTNVLHAFIDNNIPLDEIVMFKPRCHIHNPNAVKPIENLYSELDLAAIPHLNKYILGNSIKIRTIYFEDVIDTLLKSTSYMSQFYKLNALTPTSLARVAMAVTDLEWAKLYDAGKRVAHVQGADKPVVQKIGSQYSFTFCDYANVFVFESAETDWLSEKLKKHQFHEFFYWTPDLPKLVIKQAQITKQVYCANPDKHGHIELALKYLYLPHILQIRNLFNAGKPIVGTNAPNHSWIHNSKITHSKGVFIDMLSHVRDIVDKKFTKIDLNVLHCERPKIGSFIDFKSKQYPL